MPSGDFVNSFRFGTFFPVFDAYVLSYAVLLLIAMNLYQVVDLIFVVVDSVAKLF